MGNVYLIHHDYISVISVISNNPSENNVTLKRFYIPISIIINILILYLSEV